MGIQASTVGIVGGSIAGCAAAIALSRVGCHVTVYERSRGRLHGRGLGINMAPATFDELVSAGYLDRDLPTCPVGKRVWFAADGSHVGKPAWRQDLSLLSTNWSVLWQNLRARVPDSLYRQSSAVTAVHATADGAVMVGENISEEVDVLVGADGYRSPTRALVDPRGEPAYAGYVLWRGDIAADAIPRPAPDEVVGTLVTVGFDGGHAIFYRIPDAAGDGLRLNWGIYVRMPDRFNRATSLPPGSLDDALLASLESVTEMLPPYWAGIVHLTEPQNTTVQPIYDTYSGTYTRGRILLAGDAGTLTRPHTGAGALKAVQDAHALEQACRRYDNWAQVMDAYDRQRRTAGNALVELGERIGGSLVVHTPPWPTMSTADYEEWARATMSGLRNPYE